MDWLMFGFGAFYGLMLGVAGLGMLLVLRSD